MNRLCLGCGNSPLAIEGSGLTINHGLRLDPQRPWVTVAHDLNELPWPWEDNSFDQIIARSLFEHLRINLLESLDECWRILRPGGWIWLKVPYCCSERSYDDPTHYWRFGQGALDVFDPDTKAGQEYAFYTERKWRIIERPKLNKAKSSFSAKLMVRKT